MTVEVVGAAAAIWLIQKPSNLDEMKSKKGSPADTVHLQERERERVRERERERERRVKMGN